METREFYKGPNHKDGCKESFRYSGEGYNRVRLCGCGAEDHDPSPESVLELVKGSGYLRAME